MQESIVKTSTEAPKKKRYVSKTKDPGKMIYIGNLLFKKEQRAIREMFSEYGHVNSVKIIVEPETNISKGYAFVKMSSSKNAIRAVEGLNGKLVDGRTIKVSEAKELTSKSQSTLITTKTSKLTTTEKIEKKELKKKLKVKPPRRKKGLAVLFDNLAQK